MKMKRRVILSIALLLATGAPLEAARYLIVTSEALKPGFEELQRYRESPEGDSYETKLVTVESMGLPARFGPTLTLPDGFFVANDIPGDDYKAINARAAVIRDAIRTYWLEKPGEQLYVLLGGRADVIPPVMISSALLPDGPRMGFTKKTGVPTDLYYGCLSRPWEPGPTHRFFGERIIETNFFLPDAIVGRLPAPDAAAAKTYVRRMRRYLAKDEGLVPNSLLLHGTFFHDWNGVPPAPMAEGTDGYPWLASEDHPRGAIADRLPINRKVLDAELWQRNTFLTRIYPYRSATKKWRVDLFYEMAAGDPVTRDRFTDRLSIENPRDIDVYLRESPEYMMISGHGHLLGSSKLSTTVPAVPGNRWGVTYTTACNSSQIDSHAIRGGGSDDHPDPAPVDGVWRPFVMGEHAVMSGDDKCGSLVYLACSREGWSMDNIGGVGLFSHELIADFSELWARDDDKTLGEMFVEHKKPYVRRLNPGSTDPSQNENAGIWRNLLGGVNYLGDPALRPLRGLNRYYRTPFDVTLRNLDGKGASRTVACYTGQTVARQVERPVRPGKVFTGWRLDGAPYDDDEPMAYHAQGLVLDATWRDATAAELEPSRYGQEGPAFERKLYADFDSEPADGSIPSHAGGARMLYRKGPAPITRFLQTDAAADTIFTCWVYLNIAGDMFNYGQYGIAELELPAQATGGRQTAKVTLVRQGNRGYTWLLDGREVAATMVEPERWINLTMVLRSSASTAGPEGRLSFYRDGEPISTASSLAPFPIRNGTLKAALGGKLDGPFSWGAKGIQWIDEAALFQGAPGAVRRAATDRDVRELASRPVPSFYAPVVLDGKTPTRLPDPSAIAQNGYPGLTLDGSGTLGLEGGQKLPPLEIADEAEIDVRLPSSGLATMTDETKDRLGLGGLLWSGTTTEPGWSQVGPLEMKISRMDLLADGSLGLDVQVTNRDGNVSFAPTIPAGNFRLLPVSLAGEEVPVPVAPLSLLIEGNKARLEIPSDGLSPASQFFRIRYSSAL